ncbi:polysaccharide biosynthesis/export family protein [Sphingobacterium spiritivorum]|uniref:polysaccharide biosynthesis/export family protein n=1 Tax=Sphingobacterium TaxID=28453 RepID=UPI0025DCC513|nr:MULTISPECIES: polysaccharide biosynthesis/export family protein [unclassified Sphingobacterium]
MKRLIFGLMLCSVILLNSCLISKRMAYVQDMVPDSAYRVQEAKLTRIQKGDRLSIVVSAKTPELAVPFNIGESTYSVTEKGNISANGAAPGGATLTKGYLVNQTGEIDFPILGSLKVEGLSMEELKEFIRKKLIDGRLINEPIVRTELLNFRVNVMGEINKVGVIDVPDGAITLFDAVSRAGGLTSNGAPNKIAVIREENGVRKMTINNIQSEEVFQSPTYVLKQNDIVYVMPRGGTVGAKEQQSWQFISTGIGLIGILISTLILLK